MNSKGLNFLKLFMKKLYLFDFDGTLTYKDTMFLFLKFYNPQKYLWSFAKHIPLFVLVKLHLANAERVKKSFIADILKHQREVTIQKKAQEFFDEFYPKIIRENALDFIKNIDKENTESLLVSASLDIWTKPFAEKFGMKLIATEAKYKDGIFTGQFITKNNNGNEKVNRIKKEIEGKKFDKIIAFGDTSGDKPMLSLAHESHYRFFH